MLGFGLVLGLMGLMLFGTLVGLLPCMDAMKSIKSKLDEADAANELVRELSQFTPPEVPNRRNTEAAQKQVQSAKEKLTLYENALRDTVARRRDPDKGRMEWDLIDALKQRFDTLEK